ncbi:hypothetical protein CUMW_085640 [Citrus unshiu]|nr:hypothetical protein CUMW_085640 [Citrus unshiu]
MSHSKVLFVYCLLTLSYMFQFLIFLRYSYHVIRGSAYSANSLKVDPILPILPVCTLNFGSTELSLCKKKWSSLRCNIISWLATSVRVVRTGVPMASGGRRNHPLIGIPFLFIILGTVGLGGFNAARAYKKQKEAYPSHNPFLP